jgi:hypothetical protein
LLLRLVRRRSMLFVLLRALCPHAGATAIALEKLYKPVPDAYDGV